MARGHWCRLGAEGGLARVGTTRLVGTSGGETWLVGLVRAQKPHGAPETSALDYWRGEPWLQVNNVSTYGPGYQPSLRQYGRPEPATIIRPSTRF